MANKTTPGIQDLRGKIGIGTANPYKKLHVIAESGETEALVVEGNDILGKQLILGYNATGNGYGTIQTVYQGTAFTDLAINAAGGNVGIGTTDPLSKLHVSGGVTINTGNDGTFNDLNIGGINGWSNSEAHRINFVYGNGTSDIFQTIESYYGGANEGKMRFRNFYTNSAQTGILMTIHSNGNVGIGTDSPGNLLHIQSASSGFSGTYDSRYKSIVESDGEAYYATYVPDNSFSGIRFNNTSGLRAYIDYYHGTQGEYFLYSSQDSHRFTIGTSEKLRIASNGSLDFKAYGVGSFKGYALYGLGVDSSGNVVETPSSYFGTNTSNGTYTNQWHNFLELSYSTFGSSAIKIHLRGHGNTSAQSLVGEIEFNFKDQSGVVRSRATVNSYGTNPISKDEIAIYYDTTNGKINFYWKVKENYTSPQYYIDGYVSNYIWKNSYIGDDAALALETNDSVTSNLIFQGITQDQDSGYIGINAPTPSQDLVIGGSSAFSVNTQNSAYVRFGNLSSSNDIATVESLGDVVVAIDSNNSSTGKKFAVRNNGISGDELITVLDTGNVGINITNPDFKLHIAGSSPHLFLDGNFDDESRANQGRIYFNDNNFGIGAGHMTSGTNTDDDLYLWTYNGVGRGIRFMSTTNGNSDVTDAAWKTMMVVNSADDGGNVGIGTTNPGEKLDVNGGIRAYGSISSTPSNGALLGRYNSGVDIDSGELVLVTDAKTGWDEDVDEFGRIRFYSTDSSGIGARDAAVIKAINGFGDGSTTTTFSGELAFFTSSYNANIAEALRIDGDGNVGIGLSSPSYKLHIEDSAGDGRAIQAVQTGTSGTNYGGVFAAEGTGATKNVGLYANAENATTNYAALFDNGNVGIGTTSPNASLHIEKNGDQASSVKGITLSSGAAGTNKYLPAIVWSYGANGTPDFAKLEVQRSDGTGGRMLFSVANSSGTMSEAIRINESSNVGIGTTSPGHRLHVQKGGGFTADTNFATGVYSYNNSGAGISGSGMLVQAGWYNDNTTEIARFSALTSGYAQVERMVIKSNGTIRFSSYGAGFLQTDANGNITAGSVTTSDTLDDVTDNGNSTTNSITVGGVTSTSDNTFKGDTYLENGGDDGAGTHIGNVWYSVSTGGGAAPVGVYESAVIKTVNNGTHGRADLVFKTKNNSTANFGTTSEWMRITKAGLIGINETNPLYGRLQVTQSTNNDEAGIAVLSASAGRSLRLWVNETVSYISSGDSGAGILSLNPGGGNVGIGESNPASLLHLGNDTNGTNIISFGEASIGGPHGLDFYGDDATRTKKFSIYYRTGTENISMEDGGGTKRWEISQSGAVTFNQAFTFPTADGSTGAALVTNGSGSLSWNAGYQQYTPVGWGVLNNQTYTSTGANISSNSTQAQAGTTPVQRNSATEFEATKAGWYEISYSFIVKNNYTNRAMIGAYMTVSTSGGGGVISGSHSTQYVRYSTYGEYAQIQNTFYYYTSYSSTNFYLLAYLLSGSMNMTTQSISQSMISFRYINNDIT